MGARYDPLGLVVTVRLIVAFVMTVLLTVAAAAERRVALVMGADDYRTIRPLANAVNDAQAIGDALKKLGFEVFPEINRDLRRMRRALDDFREDAKGADVALVFFAGHGVEISGENRLMPVDADTSSLAALKNSTLPLEEIREAVAAVTKVGLIMLDACRNDPFAGRAGGGRSAVPLKPDVAAAAKPGLGRMGRAENILFAFSAAPGETVADGAGGHSPFTTAPAKYVGTDGLEIRSVLTLVQQEVYDLSRGKQLPYVESGLPALFFASTAGDLLPEREKLLLAMADITPDMRAEVEQVAATRDMPLAPLYGALISSDLARLTAEERARRLGEAADAFVKVRGDMRALASGDPAVTRLRQDAEEQLSLGAFEAARAKLTEAAQIDSASRERLKANYVERTLSEAATHYLSGGMARAELRYELAIIDFERAAQLYRDIEGEDVPADDRFQQILVLASIGDIYVTVGNLDAASRAFEERHKIAVDRANGDPDNMNWQRQVAVSHSEIGDVQVAQGNLAGALSSYESALSIATRLVIAETGNVELHNDLAVIYTSIGYVLRSQGDLEGALPSYEMALFISEMIAGMDPNDLERQRHLGVAHDSIGDVLPMLGKIPDALDAFNAGHAIWQVLAKARPDNAEWQRDLSISYAKIGDGQKATGDLKGALLSYEAGLAISVRLAVADPGNSERQRDLAVNHDNIGDMYLALGDGTKALDAFTAGSIVWQRLAMADPTNTRWRRDLAVSHGKIGDGRRASGDFAGALSSYEAGLADAMELTKAHASNTLWQRDLSISHLNIGEVRAMQGDLAAALLSYDKSLAITEGLAASDPSNAQWQRDLLVAHFKIASLGDDPRGHLEKALEIAARMEASGMLMPADAFIPGLLRDELAKLQPQEK
ncbi:caspase family protein [Mesorhizobium sp. KR9-304]|uniref:caspase family protein n=1 Tax=Mesorhizobium sp. KR9-304 TaxID=3156614 RepID=UPI0032B3C5E1